jgi:hypothetical protein
MPSSPLGLDELGAGGDIGEVEVAPGAGHPVGALLEEDCDPPRGCEGDDPRRADIVEKLYGKEAK